MPVNYKKKFQMYSQGVYLGCGSLCDIKSSISRTLIILGFRDNDYIVLSN